MQKQKPSHEYVVNEEVVSMMMHGVETMLDSLELLADPEKMKTIEKRIADIKAEHVKTMSASEMEAFMKKELDL